MLRMLKKRRSFPSKRIPSFRFWKAPIGTVYLVHSRDEPRLFKVGFTSRKTVARDLRDGADIGRWTYMLR